MTEDKRERIARAFKWANGEWVRIRAENPPRMFGSYELMGDDRYIVEWFRTTMLGYVAMSAPTGSHKSWYEFCDHARSRGLLYIWSEQIPMVHINDYEKEGRIPDGVPGIRDVDAPCELFFPGGPTTGADCIMDGHYLCKSCRERAMDIDVVSGVDDD